MSKTNHRHKGKGSNFIDPKYRPTYVSNTEIEKLLNAIGEAGKRHSKSFNTSEILKEERYRIAKEFKENEAQRNV